MVDKIWYNMEELIGGSEERGINRNILECKGMKYISKALYSTVLIETYWNVKFSCKPALFSLVRINRNILECKGGIYRNICTAGSINRNILECKGAMPGCPFWLP